MVEWKKLGEVCEVLDFLRKPVAKDKRNKGIYPYYGANGVQDYVEDYLFDGTYLLMGEDGSVINKDKSPILHWVSGKIWVNNHAHILKETDKAQLRYIYYSLQCCDVSDIVRGTPPKINQANMRNILIPIPSKSEQERIVSILDTFTSSIANLKEQIKERRKQYEHYRDQLLDLEGKEGVEMRTLKNIADFRNGKGHEKAIDAQGSYIVVNSKFISTNGYVKKYCKDQISPLFVDDILMVMSDLPHGKALAKCYLVKDNNKYTLNQRICAIKIKDRTLVLTKYLFIILNRNKQLLEFDNGVDQTNLRKDDILNISIPIPSKSEQLRIVSILDQFEASIANLEAQLKEREKQYEYYRNQLLTFE